MPQILQPKQNYDELTMPKGAGAGIISNAQTPTAVAPPPNGIIASAQTPTAVAPPPGGIIGGALSSAAQPTQTVQGTEVNPTDPNRDYSADLNDIYQRNLKRDGDAPGMDYFKHMLKTGQTTLEGISQAMLRSDEYKNMNPAASSGGVTAPVLGTPSQWKVTPDQTVQGQMQKLIDPNNPYYQQWATAGAQDAAGRGFTGNSSIRDTAIMNSVMAGATPIASADASTNAKAAGYNADQLNQFDMARFGQSGQMAMANLSASTQRYVADQSATTQKAIQQMSNDSQRTISQAHDAHSALIQNNQAAAQAYQQYVNAVANIDIQSTMDEGAKRAAIITQTQIFNQAIAAMRAGNPGTPDVSSPLDIGAPTASGNSAAAQVGGVDVSEYLKFPGGGNG